MIIEIIIHCTHYHHLIGQEPPAYCENSRDSVDKHDYSIICYPIICADYTVRSAHLWLTSVST